MSASDQKKHPDTTKWTGNKFLAPNGNMPSSPSYWTCWGRRGLSQVHTCTHLDEVNTCYNRNPWRKKTCVPALAIENMMFLDVSLQLPERLSDGWCLEICATKWDFDLEHARYYTAFRSPPKNSWNDLVCSWWVVTALVESVDCHDVPFSPPIVLPLVASPTVSQQSATWGVWSMFMIVHVLASDWCHLESSHSDCNNTGGP